MDVTVRYEYPDLELSDERLDGDVHVIAARGEIHLTTAPELGERLDEVLATGARSVILDLTDVAFIDSTGLGVLLNGLRKVAAAQGRLELVLANPTVLRLFEITRLEDTFDIHPTRAAALESVAYAAGNSGGAP